MIYLEYISASNKLSFPFDLSLVKNNIFSSGQIKILNESTLFHSFEKYRKLIADQKMHSFRVFGEKLHLQYNLHNCRFFFMDSLNAQSWMLNKI